MRQNAIYFNLLFDCLTMFMVLWSVCCKFHLKKLCHQLNFILNFYFSEILEKSQKCLNVNFYHFFFVILNYPRINDRSPQQKNYELQKSHMSASQLAQATTIQSQIVYFQSSSPPLIKFPINSKLSICCKKNPTNQIFPHKTHKNLFLKKRKKSKTHQIVNKLTINNRVIVWDQSKDSQISAGCVFISFLKQLPFILRRFCWLPRQHHNAHNARTGTA